MDRITLANKMYHKWFAGEYRTMVWDLVQEPLAIEDWGGDDEDAKVSGTLHWDGWLFHFPINGEM